MNNFSEKLKTLRHEFHRNPELGFQEEQTKAKVATCLRELGLDVHEGIGVVGVLKAGNSDRIIGLRADMDALPIEEASSHDYVSNNEGVMHACGHDGHTTMLLGAAELLSEKQDFDGTVVFIFQPNEEHGLGARAMLDDGFLKQFPLQEVYAIHNLPGEPLGHLSTRVGQICASESLFEITISGKGGHASMPQVGVDAITVGADIVMSLQTVVSRKLPPDAGAVLSVTEFITDGQRNVLPGEAILKGDVRARLPEHRGEVEKFMNQIIEGVAAAHGAAVELSFDTEFIETINSAEPVSAAVAVGKKTGLVTEGDRVPMSFSEDFAHFCAEVPGAFLLLGNGDAGSHGQPLHAADYDFNDELLTIGAEYWTALVRDRLTPGAS